MLIAATLPLRGPARHEGHHPADRRGRRRRRGHDLPRLPGQGRAVRAAVDAVLDPEPTLAELARVDPTLPLRRAAARGHRDPAAPADRVFNLMIALRHDTRRPKEVDASAGAATGPAPTRSSPRSCAAARARPRPVPLPGGEVVAAAAAADLLRLPSAHHRRQPAHRRRDRSTSCSTACAAATRPRPRPGGPPVLIRLLRTYLRPYGAAADRRWCCCSSSARWRRSTCPASTPTSSTSGVATGDTGYIMRTGGWMLLVTAGPDRLLDRRGLLRRPRPRWASAATCARPIFHRVGDVLRPRGRRSSARRR